MANWWMRSIVALTLLVTAGGIRGEELLLKDSFRGKHQLGVHLGAWHNLGESPLESGPVNESGTYQTNIKETAFYFEGYFGYRLLPWMLGEFSLGTVNRGSVTINEGNATDVGNLILYPIMAQLRFYPPVLTLGGVHAFVLAGGGLCYGRRTVQFTNAGSYYSNWEEESGTDFTYILGAGLDWPVAPSIAVDFGVKYMPINLALVTIDNYDAITFTVGVKYLYSSQ